jgi:hypothetical protein
VVLSLGGLVPYADHHENGYRFASFVPSRPLLGHQFTVEVYRGDEERKLFSFTVPMRHETVLSADTDDADLLEQAVKTVAAGIGPAAQFDAEAARKALTTDKLPHGLELQWNA